MNEDLSTIIHHRFKEIALSITYTQKFQDFIEKGFIPFMVWNQLIAMKVTIDYNIFAKRKPA